MPLDPRSPAFTVLLGTIAAVPPLSIDMGLPGLPQIQAEFATSAGEAGLSLSLFIATFALAQIAFGPLSDRFGRRPVLLAGCLVYLAAGIGCTLAPSIGWLLFWRAVAGSGAGASTVLAFAIVRDLFEGPAGRVRQSYVSLVQSVAPVIAPTIGAGILAAGGWRAIYGTLAVVGCGLLVAVQFGLAESRDRGKTPRLTVGGALAGYGRVLGNRWCLGHALAGGLSFGSLFAFISGSPAVLMGDLGVSPGVFALLFAATSAAISAGAALNGRLGARGVRASLPLGCGLALLCTAGAAALLVLAAGRESLPVIMPLFILNSFGFGLVISNAIHAVLEPMPEIAGIAASVFGCCQFLCGALSSALAAALFAVLGPASTALAMTISATAALASWWFIAGPAPSKSPGPSRATPA